MKSYRKYGAGWIIGSMLEALSIGTNDLIQLHKCWMEQTGGRLDLLVKGSSACPAPFYQKELYEAELSYRLRSFQEFLLQKGVTDAHICSRPQQDLSRGQVSVIFLLREGNCPSGKLHNLQEADATWQHVLEDCLVDRDEGWLAKALTFHSNCNLSCVQQGKDMHMNQPALQVGFVQPTVETRLLRRLEETLVLQFGTAFGQTNLLTEYDGVQMNLWLPNHEDKHDEKAVIHRSSSLVRSRRRLD